MICARSGVCRNVDNNRRRSSPLADFISLKYYAQSSQRASMSFSVLWVLLRLRMCTFFHERAKWKRTRSCTCAGNHTCICTSARLSYQIQAAGMYGCVCVFSFRSIAPERRGVIKGHICMHVCRGRAHTRVCTLPPSGVRLD